MTGHWKDVHECWRLVRRGVGYRDQRVYIADNVDTARAKDAAEIARLHDIIAAYEAVTDPEQHPDLFARSSEVLEGCRNPVCSDQAVVQDLRDQVAAKDAEIARLTAQVRGALLRPDTDGDGA